MQHNVGGKSTAAGRQAAGHEQQRHSQTFTAAAWFGSHEVILVGFCALVLLPQLPRCNHRFIPHDVLVVC